MGIRADHHSNRSWLPLTQGETDKRHTRKEKANGGRKSGPHNPPDYLSEGKQKKKKKKRQKNKKKNTKKNNHTKKEHKNKNTLVPKR